MSRRRNSVSLFYPPTIVAKSFVELWREGCRPPLLADAVRDRHPGLVRNVLLEAADMAWPQLQADGDVSD